VSTLSPALLRFEAEFNDLRLEIAPASAPLAIDACVSTAVWGAFFDCYEAELRQELGEDEVGVAALRSQLVFTDSEHRSLGFSEYFPIEELGVDEYRSQLNRRAEILFFETGEEPDTTHAAEDPETSEMYLPGFYERVPLDIRKEDLAFGHIDIHLHVPLQSGRADAVYRLKGELGYDQTLPASGARVESATFLALRFGALNRKDKYSLEHVMGEARLEVFRGLPFSQLIAISKSMPSAACGRNGSSDYALEYDVAGVLAS
jgi:hypothetical protein